MNNAQKKIVTPWIIAVVLLVGIIFFQEIISSHWGILKYPALFAIIVAIAITNKGQNVHLEKEGRATLNEVTDRYPILKWIIGIYGIGIFLTSIFIVRNGYQLDVSFGLLFLLLIPLLLPRLFLEFEKYKDLGDIDKSDAQRK